jgi:hypothetical protein
LEVSVWLLSRRREEALALRPPVTGERLRALKFERTGRPGGYALGEWGVVTLSQGDLDLRLRAGMTWEALAVLRGELSRLGMPAPDEVIVCRVLRCWVSEQASGYLSRGAHLPVEGLVLRLEGGPLSLEPRRLLKDAGLLA